MDPPPRIELDNLSVAYGGIVAVRSVSGTFDPGTLTAIVGPNGAGKSTLLKAIAGLIPLACGTIRRGKLRRRDFAYLPQRAAIDREFPITVFDTVIAGAWHAIGAFGAATPKIVRRTMGALAEAGLDDLAQRPVASLSEGQFQRVLFARMVLQEAPVVLLDEPFAAIDNRTVADLLRLVQRWRDEGRTVIAVLHDLDQVRRHFPHTLLLAGAPVAWGPTSRVLTPENLQFIYGYRSSDGRIVPFPKAATR